MISIQQQQQIINRELFQLNSERLKYLIPVNKASSRKRSKSSYFLAIGVNNINNHILYLIKKIEQTYIKNQIWQFDEIEQIDPKSDSVEPEFEIHFKNKQIFSWIANSLTEKSSFLQTIKQIINQVPAYFHIKFINIANGQPSSALVFNQLDEINANEKFDQNGNEWTQETDPYQTLTNREETDLERLLQLEVENTIHNAEAFTEKLSRDLASMDTLNIQDIMASEQRVQNLMQILQNTIDETLRLENKIIGYENLLKNVRDIVSKVEKKEAIIQIYNENNLKLSNELETIVTRLDFPKEDEYLLKEFDLNTVSSYSKCTEIVNRLLESIQFELSPSLNSLNGVVEQRRYLNEIATNFLQNLMKQLKKIIMDFASEYNEKSSMSRGNDTVLNEHSKVHNRLMCYHEFIKWIRSYDQKSYSALIQFYSNQFSAVYEKEFNYFFDYLRERYVYNSKGNQQQLKQLPQSPSSQFNFLSDAVKRKSLAAVDYRRGSLASSANTDAIDNVSLRSSEASLSEWEEFDSYIEFLLKSIDPVCLAEQNFCNKFFDLDNSQYFSIPSTPTMTQKSTPSETDVSNHSSSLSEHSIQSKRQDKLRSILAELFKSFENEFINFIAHYDKVDGLYSVYFLVRLTNHVLNAQDTGSFLSKSYGNILIQVKRNFDRYMQSQQTEIEEAKDPKRTKIGVLSFVKRFEIIAKQIENIVKYGNQRRPDIDRWYVILMERIFQSISRIAKEHQKVYKTPSQIIEIENYHYLQIMLSSLKIPCLANEKKLSKEFYNNALQEYVNINFRRPLEKLNIFFEGVEQKVNQGIKKEEIGYQLAFNKQELRKVIKECNLKDIKKGLEEMYRRVEKHVSDPESTLIQVIWHSMQEEFIIQYKHIQDMIERCYPQSNITLQFTIENVLNIFSEIALQH
ncbi:exocyst complex component 1-like protein [Sarcoptes scabiei]|uniref:Exocyst complex component 1-like protein n=1 Tax=Sarcoptes scabiei TaxID=52283 RepID=A0A132AGC2_SARSC|nr:exocyst complex component 1-like protein [Sarcoptes scabiei]